MMDPIAPETPIPVTLQAQEWNLVLDVISDGRFRVVAPLIQKIHEQAQAAQTTTNQPPQLKPVA